MIVEKIHKSGFIIGYYSQVLVLSVKLLLNKKTNKQNADLTFKSCDFEYIKYSIYVSKLYDFQPIFMNIYSSTDYANP